MIFETILHVVDFKRTKNPYLSVWVLLFQDHIEKK